MLSNDSDSENINRGASIKPSARRGIHSHHSSRPFKVREDMGRYGLNINRIEESAGPSHEGRDEVDNIMSKLTCPSNPQLIKKKEIPRRKSLDAQNDLYTDDENNVLSKSVPATLPSYSYSSYDTNEWPIENNQDISDGSFESATCTTPLLNKHNRSNNASLDSMIPDSIGLSKRYTHVNQLARQDNTVRNIFSAFTVIASLLITICASILITNNVSNGDIYDERTFYNDMNNLGDKYKISDNSILQVQTGISTIFKRKDTGSFVFVYNSRKNNFNPSEFDNFMDDVSYAASKYLRNDSTSARFTMVEGSKLEMEEHGDLIDRFREDLAQTGVMLVKHVEAIPSALAMAFHYYCDEYNPVVKKSAIFFTLNLAKCSHIPGQKSTHAHIEKCLADKWDKVPPDNIVPLLTRVVSVVLDVTSVF